MNKRKLKNIKIEQEIARLEKKHDKIENPVCYTGNCPICNKIKELKEKEKNG